MIFLISLRWMYRTNMNLAFTNYTISFRSLPKSFDGYKIAQLSDFHNRTYGDVTTSIINGLHKEKPDLIAITGDFVDSRDTNIDVSLQLVKELVKIAPCYYVTGNHESRLDEKMYRQFEEGLTKYGVEIMRTRTLILSKGDEQISIIGVDDPCFNAPINEHEEMLTAEKINEITSKDIFSILLSHRPEYYVVYKDANVNLVLTGHAHGGQFRIPFIGGLFAPNQGFFPKFDGGVYQEDEFAMVVSRGIGNSVMPIRFNNQPEVVIVELER